MFKIDDIPSYLNLIYFADGTSDRMINRHYAVYSVFKIIFRVTVPEQVRHNDFSKAKEHVTETLKHLKDSDFGVQKEIFYIMLDIIGEDNRDYQLRLLTIAYLAYSMKGSEDYVFKIAAELCENAKNAYGENFVKYLTADIQNHIFFTSIEDGVYTAALVIDPLRIPNVQDIALFFFGNKTEHEEVSNRLKSSANAPYFNLVLEPIYTADVSDPAILLTLSIAFLAQMDKITMINDLRERALKLLTAHNFFEPYKKITIDSITAYISQEFPKLKHGN